MRTQYVGEQLCFMQEDGRAIMMVPDSALSFLGDTPEQEIHPLLLFAMMAALDADEPEAEPWMEMELRLGAPLKS